MRAARGGVDDVDVNTRLGEKVRHRGWLSQFLGVKLSEGLRAGAGRRARYGSGVGPDRWHRVERGDDERRVQLLLQSRRRGHVGYPAGGAPPSPCQGLQEPPPLPDRLSLPATILPV